MINLRKYYQKERYLDEKILWRAEEYFPSRFKTITKKLRFTFSGVVLDAGCGDGSLVKEILGRHSNCVVYGADISEQGCQLAKKYCKDAKVANFNEHIPYDAAMFDSIISHEVIEHIVDPDIFLEECNRVLKNSGYIIITTPNLLAWHQRILCIIGIIPSFYELSTRDKRVGLGFMNKLLCGTQPVGHVRVFNRRGLADILELYGFKILVFKSLSIRYEFPWPLRIVFNALDWLFSLFPSLGSNFVVLAQKSNKL